MDPRRRRHVRVVVALGGNALLRRGEAMTSEDQPERAAGVRAPGAAGRRARARHRPARHDRGADIGAMLNGAAGTTVSLEADGVILRDGAGDG